MARFRGTVVGNRSVASRLGHATSGLEVTANGWNFGVRVELVADDKNERDVAHIFLTGGSNGGRETYLGEFDKDSLEGGRVFFGATVKEEPSQDLDVPELVTGLEASGLNVITIDEDTDFSKLPSLGELLGRKEK